MIAGGIIFLSRRYCAKVKQNDDNVQFSALQHEPSRVVSINFRHAEPDLEINQKPPCKFVPVPVKGGARLQLPTNWCQRRLEAIT